MEPAPAVPSYAILVEKDVDVPMRDGARLKADVFRPDDGGNFRRSSISAPTRRTSSGFRPDTLEEKPNPLMNWETVNPEWWVPKGYAAVRVDGRGSGKSPGQCEPWSLAEAVDFYDAIEWAAAQPWCNGKVGLSGISYFAINQWFVANLQPPSLKAIIPWEGFADLYRDALFHGGILSVFMTNWFTAHLMHHTVGRASQQLPERLADQHAAFLAQQQSRQRRLPWRAGAMGQDHGADVHGRQLVGHGAASARQYRGLHARGLQAQEAAHPGRHARASVLHRGGPARSAPLLRLLAQGHRQRRDGRAAGEARDPQGPRRDRMAPRARMAARAHAMDQVLFRPVAAAARRRAERRRAGLDQSGRGPARAPIRRPASARWARPRRRRRR